MNRVTRKNLQLLPDTLDKFKELSALHAQKLNINRLTQDQFMSVLLRVYKESQS